MQTWIPAVRAEDEADITAKEREKEEKAQRALLETAETPAPEPEPEIDDADELVKRTCEGLLARQAKLEEERADIQAKIEAVTLKLEKWLRMGEELGLVKAPHPRSGKARKSRRKS